MEKRKFEATRLETGDLIIDGLLNEPAWQEGKWFGDFIQHDPYEGIEPSQQSSCMILYDNDNIYIAFRAFDTSPDSISKRRSRRDDIDGDFVAVQFDSYFDRRTAFTFIVNAAGVKMDGVFTSDGESEDWTWDPIWWVNSNIDEQGWTAEMKIPLSQLRFGNSNNQVWGLQLARMLFRKEEMSLWQHIPKDASGWVHNFGELHGISNIRPRRQVEIAPYVVGSLERFKKVESNPFETGKRSKLSGGVDGKIGVTNNLTLDFTVNPDFGQVEADPSQVNLTAYETFFEEKRPFFIEGRSILSLPLMFGDGDLASENLFYTRRIGRRPQYHPDVDGNAYIDYPDNTSILGAAKLTGKTKNGWSIGFLESVTAEEKAEIDNEGARSFETVEPLTNYLVGSIQKDFREGQTVVGGMFTSINRKIDNPNLEFLHSDAYTGGLNFSHDWKDRTYNVSFKTYFSHVRGSEEAIIRTQRSSARYFQRPDANYMELDSSRTSLSGSGGVISIGKIGSGHVRFATFLSWKSPGLEVNDLGFFQSTDEILQVLWIGYRIWEPFSIFRNLNINLNQWNAWDFGWHRNVTGGNINFHTQFKNYWNFGGGINPTGRRLSNSILRGGPSVIMPGNISVFANLRTDNRKKLSGGLMTNHNWGYQGSSRNQRYALQISFKPSNALNLSLFPSLTLSERDLQYITVREYGGDARYIFGSIDQKTLVLSLRLNYSITPNLTIQYWGQPFVSAGKYDDFKMITDPKAETYSDLFHVYT
ncbi:MAG: carbohydrate binding family 9 domain-containing protein, partial [Bacteroidales bacterium]